MLRALRRLRTFGLRLSPWEGGEVRGSGCCCLVLRGPSRRWLRSASRQREAAPLGLRVPFPGMSEGSAFLYVTRGPLWRNTCWVLCLF